MATCSLYDVRTLFTSCHDSPSKCHFPSYFTCYEIINIHLMTHWQTLNNKAVAYDLSVSQQNKKYNTQRGGATLINACCPLAGGQQWQMLVPIIMCSLGLGYNMKPSQQLHNAFIWNYFPILAPRFPLSSLDFSLVSLFSPSNSLRSPPLPMQIFCLLFSLLHMAACVIGVAWAL